MYTDESLTCVECQRSFTFTASQQEFFASKGFANKPSRCDDCRAARKSAGGGGRSPSYAGSSRELFKVTCSQCGAAAEVPFQPRAGRPVYCRDCYSTARLSYR
jgi:CxxC-x17-CxxC domain-containing protein